MTCTHIISAFIFVFKGLFMTGQAKEGQVGDVQIGMRRETSVTHGPRAIVANMK
jgi:hypothetical protein